MGYNHVSQVLENFPMTLTVLKDKLSIGLLFLYPNSLDFSSFYVLTFLYVPMSVHRGWKFCGPSCGKDKLEERILCLWKGRVAPRFFCSSQSCGKLITMCFCLATNWVANLQPGFKNLLGSKIHNTRNDFCTELNCSCVAFALWGQKPQDFLNDK